MRKAELRQNVCLFLKFSFYIAFCHSNIFLFGHCFFFQDQIAISLSFNQLSMPIQISNFIMWWRIHCLKPGFFLFVKWIVICSSITFFFSFRYLPKNGENQYWVYQRSNFFFLISRKHNFELFLDIFTQLLTG